MKIKPIFDRVVLLPKEAEKETQSGIILPTASQEKSQIATVVAVGEGGNVDGKEVVMQVKVGQEVLYAKYSGTEFSLDGQKYIIIKQTVDRNQKNPDGQHNGCKHCFDNILLSFFQQCKQKQRTVKQKIR
mgnify:CR=1 FL=1